jgi:predicted amidophosphoribosyltransferase
MLDALWPTRCVGCAAVGRGRLCPNCRAGLHLRPVSLPVRGLDGAVAASAYASALGSALRAAKYGHDRHTMRWLAAAFASQVGPWAAGASFDAVVPVPSPWTRRMRRGFSPAAVLARCLARAIGVPMRRPLRARPGPRQARLDVVERWENPRRRLRGRGTSPARVLLVDDVITTGATAATAAAHLRDRGAHTVLAATLCVAELRGPEQTTAGMS